MTDEEKKKKKREYMKLWRTSHPKEYSEYLKQRRLANLEKYREYGRKYYYANHGKRKECIKKGKLARKMRVFANYGGKCSYDGCTETDIDVMELHHANLDGFKRREEEGGVNGGMWGWVERNNFPADIIMVCANHHLKIHAMARRVAERKIQ